MQIRSKPCIEKKPWSCKKLWTEHLLKLVKFKIKKKTTNKNLS